MTLGHALYVAHDEACLAVFRRARRAAAAAGRTDAVLEAWNWEAAALQMFGRARQSLVAYEQLERAAREHGKRLWVDQAAWSAARTRLLAFGEIQPALTEMRRMAGRRTLSLNRPQLLADIAVSLADTGEADEARRFLGRAESEADTSALRMMLTSYRAEIELASGRAGRCLQVCDAALEGRLQQPIVSLMRCLRLWALFDLHRPQADPAIAADIPMFAGLALERDAFAALAAGRREEAEESFLAAAAVWHDNVLRYALRARWAAGELARRGGTSSGLSSCSRGSSGTPPGPASLSSRAPDLAPAARPRRGAEPGPAGALASRARGPEPRLAGADVEGDRVPPRRVAEDGRHPRRHVDGEAGRHEGSPGGRRGKHGPRAGTASRPRRRSSWASSPPARR